MKSHKQIPLETEPQGSRLTEFCVPEEHKADVTHSTSKVHSRLRQWSFSSSSPPSHQKCFPDVLFRNNYENRVVILFPCLPLPDHSSPSSTHKPVLSTCRNVFSAHFVLTASTVDQPLSIFCYSFLTSSVLSVNWFYQIDVTFNVN